MDRSRPFAIIILLSAVVIGCQSPAPVATPEWEKLRTKVERYDYTLLRVGDENYVKEVQDMFRFKEAYFWLIDAMESEDPNVARTANALFSASGTAGDISRAALRTWYQSMPMGQWKLKGLLWEPAPCAVARV